MRRSCGWILSATLSAALTIAGIVAATMPAHAQSIAGLGQAGAQVDRCPMAMSVSPMCGATTSLAGGAGWLWTAPVIEPAVGLRPFVCPRDPGDE